jgi:hypothetical protein
MPNKANTKVVSPFEGAVNQVVNPDGSIVPVQYVASPDSVYNLSAEEFADVVDLADDWFNGCDLLGKGKTLRSDTAKAIKKMLGELPEFAKYHAYRQAFINQMLNSGKTKNDTSAGQMWNELIDLVRDICKPFAIPKSPKPNSQRMQSKREQDRKALESLSDDELLSALANFTDSKQFTKCNMVQTVLTQREKLRVKNDPKLIKAQEELKAKRDSIIADIRKIKSMDHLAKIQAYMAQYVPKVV